MRGAISKANADTSGAYTITFAPSLNGITHTLSLAGTGEDGNATGDLDITDDLTITGNGARNTVVNASGLDRVFDIPSGGIIVALNDMTIQNGDASDGDGGGIYNAGTLTINRSTISSNSVTFVSNNGGGGIFNNGTITINHSAVHNNIANGGNFDSGGGLFNSFTGLVNINNSTFSLNTAGLLGGAIFDEGTAVTIRNSTFSDNASLFLFTGGIETGGTVNIQNSIITSSAGDDCG
ncbi:MAG: hypothetical protein IPL78_18580 [Chloroflexi bacterium]|nr:hypothetical protein [Chloroflexota bacterium]